MKGRACASVGPERMVGRRPPVRRDRSALEPDCDRADDPDGEQLGWVRIYNDPVALGLELAKAGPGPGRGAYQVRTWRAWYAHITTKATTT